jgi:SepF-like predicted cell division protein (DUF552 family)
MSDTLRAIKDGLDRLFKTEPKKKTHKESMAEVLVKIRQYEADLDKQLRINKAQVASKDTVVEYDTSKCEAEQVVYVDIGSGVRRSAYLGWK